MKKCVFGFVMLAATNLVNAQIWEGNSRIVHVYDGERAKVVDNSKIYVTENVPFSTTQVEPRILHIYDGERAKVVDNSKIYVPEKVPFSTVQVEPRIVHVYEGERAKVVDNPQGFNSEQTYSISQEVKHWNDSAHSGITLKQVAIGAAFADAITTKIMINSGGYERNPLIKPTTSGLLTAAAVNWAIVEMVDRSNLEPTTKKNIMKAGASMWTGAAVNNLAIALSASNPVALAVGVAAGAYMWNSH